MAFQLQVDWLNSMNKKPVEKFRGNCETCEFGFECETSDRCIAHRKVLDENPGMLCEEYGVSYKYFTHLQKYIEKEGRYPEGTPEKVIAFMRDGG